MADSFNNSILMDLSMVKGDTLSFGFQLQGLGGTRPDSIYFACKDQLESEDYIFNKILNDGVSLKDYDETTDILTYIVRVAPSDTENIDCGRYFYDLSVNVNNDVLTLMKGRLLIDWEVKV